ncbi:MAG: DUF4266 domain-containing protein [Deltaproteobacteria bacterium]|nr:DUF4266 domain-containing protein [Deltaproteobacteria bacterium]
MLKRTNLLIAAVALIVAILGCAEVKPWQKGNLAKSHMAFDTDPAESRFTQHVYTSKEGSHGGYGIGGGGCGCN